MVSHWNQVAVDASGRDHSPGALLEQFGPTRSSRAIAIVQIAVHDAVQAIEQRYETYLPQEPEPLADRSAAVAQAAHDTLVELYPSQTAIFNEELARDLATIPEGPAKVLGREVGRRAAEAILANRAEDGSEPAVQTGEYLYGILPGEWREDPLTSHPPYTPQWRQVRPFVLDSADQFLCPPPPALESEEYAVSFNETKRLGGDGVTTATERTEDQTLAGIYWAYDGAPSLCAPPRLYNQLVRSLAEQEGVTNLGDLARLMALVSIAQADTAIACWDSKYHYNFWRPVTGIREADPGEGLTGLGDGNPLTTGDPDWTPLGAPASNLSGVDFTPPFPTYPSGHASFGGALFEILRQEFGTDEIAFTFVSDELNGETVGSDGQVRPLHPRSFSSLSEAEEENGQSRVYLGIHWSFDKTEGIKQGRSVANFVRARVLRELPFKSDPKVSL